MTHTRPPRILHRLQRRTFPFRTGSALSKPHGGHVVQEEVFCDEFHLADLRVYDECTKLVKGCDHVFNLAADMGGMGFIQSNHSVIL